MTRKKRSVGGTLVVDEVPLRWEIRSEPQRGAQEGDIGLRLTVVADGKARRELILEYPFEKRTKKPSRFAARPKIDPVQLEADVRLAIEAGWQPKSRGRPFIFALYDEEGT